MIGITLIPFLTGDLGWIYLAAAAGLGALFLALAVRLLQETTSARARGLYSNSQLYLALQFVAMAIDPVVLGA
jgi:protoheme IX farnesyltransferase